MHTCYYRRYSCQVRLVFWELWWRLVQFGLCNVCLLKKFGCLRLLKRHSYVSTTHFHWWWSNFSCKWKINRHNCRVKGKQNPHDIIQNESYPPKFSGCCRIMMNTICRPFVLHWKKYHMSYLYTRECRNCCHFTVTRNS